MNDCTCAREWKGRNEKPLLISTWATVSELLLILWLIQSETGKKKRRNAKPHHGSFSIGEASRHILPCWGRSLAPPGECRRSVAAAACSAILFVAFVSTVLNLQDARVHLWGVESGDTWTCGHTPHTRNVGRRKLLLLSDCFDLKRKHWMRK